MQKAQIYQQAGACKSYSCDSFKAFCNFDEHFIRRSRNTLRFDSAQRPVGELRPVGEFRRVSERWLVSGAEPSPNNSSNTMTVICFYHFLQSSFIIDYICVNNNLIFSPMKIYFKSHYGVSLF